MMKPTSKPTPKPAKQTDPKVKARLAKEAAEREAALARCRRRINDEAAAKMKAAEENLIDQVLQMKNDMNRELLKDLLRKSGLLSPKPWIISSCP